jgi:dephospho-CoA kinase
MIVLVDGRSGAGKTRYATALAARLGATLVSLDDVYPGWQGLDAGSAAVPDIITDRRYRSWNWEADAAGAWRELPADGDLVVEGVGSISRASRPFADRAIWIELDEATRLRRAHERDGDRFAPYWQSWAAQEDRFIARENPRELADEIISGV